MIVVPIAVSKNITNFFDHITLQIINQRLLARARIDHRRFPARFIKQDITIGRHRPMEKRSIFIL